MNTNTIDNIKRFKDHDDYYAEPLDSSILQLANGESGNSSSNSELEGLLHNTLLFHISGNSSPLWLGIAKPTSGPSWLFTGYYASPYETKNKIESWNKLESTSTKNSLPWLVIGDFNSILHDNEKYSTQPLDSAEANIFSNKILDLDLNDLGTVGCPFTWSNKRSDPSLTEQRLDRGLTTEFWILLYPNSTISNLLAIGSDHHPIFLNPNPSWHTGKIPFKFFGPWLDHKDCKYIIAECWQTNLSGSSAFLIARKLKDIKMKLKVWNKEVYGNIKTNIEESKQHLLWLQENYFRADRSTALKTAMQLLRDWQDIEEHFWKTKSRDRFIKLGDKNTSYFHITAKCRTRRNRIDTIQDNKGNWIEDYQELKFHQPLHHDGHC
ncbi:uncharacterized protein LOC113333629 [Papaver somniferum]|uniref:uncharacterized protein LOC113333629 n=1 Tax=Papaver somniferum TaxID=3469 RepID=UPI000E6FA95F|nr:uncharacterized protein LOC113333629 [Papaver somniferum]